METAWTISADSWAEPRSLAFSGPSAGIKMAHSVNDPRTQGPQVLEANQKQWKAYKIISALCHTLRNLKVLKLVCVRYRKVHANSVLSISRAHLIQPHKKLMADYWTKSLYTLVGFPVIIIHQQAWRWSVKKSIHAVIVLLSNAQFN